MELNPNYHVFVAAFMFDESARFIYVQDGDNYAMQYKQTR